jgi:glycosyltransferase involved in cell wall biosynthesis
LVAEYLCRTDGIVPTVVLADQIEKQGATTLRTENRAHGSSRIQIVIAPQPFRRLGEQVLRGRYESAQRMFWEQIGLLVAFRRLGLHVLYSPYHALPIFPPVRSIVTIHDLIPLSESAYRGPPLAQAYFWLACTAARQAAAVVTDSHFSRAEIERLLHIPRERIHVVPLGVEAHFTSVQDTKAIDRARARLGLPESYLFYVGGADERKNIGVLLRALALVRDGALGDVHVPPLVIAANAGDAGSTPWHPDWRARARALGLEREVHWVDRIAEEDLPAVYRHAVAFCFPSRIEGFGLTPLEALACGTPVLCANTSSLPEVVGDAGLLLPPDDPAEWARAMVRFSGDSHLRRGLGDAGVRRAANFSWESTGAGVLEVIRDVASGGGRS